MILVLGDFIFVRPIVYEKKCYKMPTGQYERFIPDDKVKN